MSTLYLIPSPLGDAPLCRMMPPYNRDIIRSLRHFIVENVRTARRFLKQVDNGIDIDSLTFYELNRHTDRQMIATYLTPMSKGCDIGIISEAGCPAVADPGADVVAIAQEKGYKVVPLVGPSSILMSLMASGFNGQSFAFVGYLPIDRNERAQRLKALERRAYSEDSLKHHHGGRVHTYHDRISMEESGRAGHAQTAVHIPYIQIGRQQDTLLKTIHFYQYRSGALPPGGQTANEL